jgi:hypothetical protein
MLLFCGKPVDLLLVRMIANKKAVILGFNVTLFDKEGYFHGDSSDELLKVVSTAPSLVEQFPSLQLEAPQYSGRRLKSVTERLRTTLTPDTNKKRTYKVRPVCYSRRYCTNL